MRSGDPIRAMLLTPPGRGAVASIVVRGLDALKHVEPLFQAVQARPLSDTAVDQVLFGRWTSTGEEVVLAKRIDGMEIHCHGGAASTRAILDDLSRGGCQVVDWQTKPDVTGDAI